MQEKGEGSVNYSQSEQQLPVPSSPMYTPSLQYLVNLLEPKGYALSNQTLRNYPPDVPLSLWDLVAQHLRVDSNNEIPIANAQPGGEGSIFVLTGTVSLLGMNNAAFKATFCDTLPPSFPLSPTAIPRAVTCILEITTPANWTMGQSFLEVKGTFFDALTFAQPPVFILSSYAHQDSERKVAVETGLNLYGLVQLSSCQELQIASHFLGSQAPQILVGPIQRMATGTTALIDLALHSPDGKPYLHQYPHFPQIIFDVHLQTITAMGNDPPHSSAAQVTLTAQLDMSSALTRISGMLPITGAITNSQTLTLAYDVPVATPVDIDALGRLVEQPHLRDSFPTELRTSDFNLTQACLRVTPTEIERATFGVATSQWPLVPKTWLILQDIQVLLAFAPAGTPSCTLTGVALPPMGLKVQTTSNNGFAYPFTLTHDTTDSQHPAFEDLATAFNLAANLPADISGMGTAYTFQDFALRVASATSVTALTHLVMQPPWTLVHGQHTTVSAENAAITLQWIANQNSSGTIQATTTFMNQPVTIQLALPAPASYLLTISVPSPTFLFPSLATTILGSITVPPWLQSVGFTSGTLEVDYRALAFTDASRFIIPGTLALKDDSTLSALSVTLSTDAQSARMCLNCDWTWQWGTPVQTYHGVVCNSYAGDTSPPFTQFKDNDIQQLITIPQPKNIPPDRQKAPDVNAEIILDVIVLLTLSVSTLVFCLWYMYRAGFLGTLGARLAAAMGLVRVRPTATVAAAGNIPIVMILSTLVQLFGYDLPGTVKDMVAAALHPLLPTEMAVALVTAFPDLSAPHCADALAGGYALSAQEMTIALQTAAFPAPMVAPVVHRLYPHETETAGEMAGILLHAYISLDVAVMAEALASAHYSPSDVAPVLHKRYPDKTTTAEAMATILQEAYTTLSAQTLVNALATIPYSVYETTQVALQRYPAQMATALSVARLLLTAGYTALPVLPVLCFDFPLATQTALDCARILYDANCPETVARFSLLAVGFTPAVVDDALRHIYIERTTMMLLNNLVKPQQPKGEIAYFEITSSLGDTVNGQIVPWGSRYVVPAGPPPYSVKMGIELFSRSDTVTGIASADVVATLFYEAEFIKVFTSSPNLTEE
jgi:hypothetical protein